MRRQLFKYHPVVGHTFVPNLRVRVEHEAGGYLVATNSLGFRSDREFPRARSGGTLRVLLFGDSFTAGDGVNNGARYGDLIERGLEGVEVFNFGMSGTGTDQQFLIFSEFAREVECDLVVIGVLVENVLRLKASAISVPFGDEAEAFAAKPYYDLQGGELVLRNVPVPREILKREQLPKEATVYPPTDLVSLIGARLSGSGGNARDALQRLTRYQKLKDYDSPSSRGWLLMRAILKQWIAAVPAKVLVFPIPSYQYAEEMSSAEQCTARFAELAAETGVAVHDALPDLLAYPLAERRAFRFERDVHPTPKGHRAYADSVLGPIRRLLDR